MQRSILSSKNIVASRIARQSLAARQTQYSDEVGRLLDAGRAVMRDKGTSARPRVADIVAAAGLSNDAFYRHFASKDDLVAAILEDGTQRLAGYLGHQMAKEASPRRQVARWIEGVMAQAADDDIAATTLAVMWNSVGIGVGMAAVPPPATAPLAALLEPTFVALGIAEPGPAASLVAHAVVGRLSDHLWNRRRPTADEIDFIITFCLDGLGVR